MSKCSPDCGEECDNGCIVGNSGVMAGAAPTRKLPSCMMPDGAEPCEAFQELQRQLDVARDALKSTLFALELQPMSSYDDQQYINGVADIARTALSEVEG